MEFQAWFKATLPIALLAAAVACDNGPGGDPIIPDTPNQASGGSGGAGTGGATTTSTTGGGGPMGGAGGGPIPDPTADWSAFGASHQLLPELHVIAPNEIYAVASDPLEVGNVIAMYDGAQWATMTDGRGGLRNAFHYIAPLEPLEPSQFMAVVSNHLELWDGLQWNIMTPNALGLHDGLHYIDNENIYAPVGEQIQMYDGVLDQWVSITEDVPAPYVMTRAFHWITDIEIYAVVENGLESEILMWDGTWNTFAAPIEGLKPEIHFVSPTEIYAVIGSQICVWNGTMWSPWTDDLPSLKNAFSFVGPNDIYAIAGIDQVWHWSP